MVHRITNPRKIARLFSPREEEPLLNRRVLNLERINKNLIVWGILTKIKRTNVNLTKIDDESSRMTNVPNERKNLKQKPFTKSKKRQTVRNTPSRYKLHSLTIMYLAKAVLKPKRTLHKVVKQPNRIPHQDPMALH